MRLYQIESSEPFPSGAYDLRVGAGSPRRMRAAAAAFAVSRLRRYPAPPGRCVLTCSRAEAGAVRAATGKSPLLPVRPLSFLAAVIYGKSGHPGGGAGQEARGWETRNLCGRGTLLG